MCVVPWKETRARPGTRQDQSVVGETTAAKLKSILEIVDAHLATLCFRTHGAEFDHIVILFAFHVLSPCCRVQREENKGTDRSR